MHYFISSSQQPFWQDVLIGPFYRWEHWGTERWRDVSMVREEANDRTRIEALAYPAPVSVLADHIITTGIPDLVISPLDFFSLCRIAYLSPSNIIPARLAWDLECVNVFSDIIHHLHTHWTLLLSCQELLLSLRTSVMFLMTIWTWNHFFTCLWSPWHAGLLLTHFCVCWMNEWMSEFYVFICIISLKYVE